MNFEEVPIKENYFEIPFISHSLLKKYEWFMKNNCRDNFKIEFEQTPTPAMRQGTLFHSLCEGIITLEDLKIAPTLNITPTESKIYKEHLETGVPILNVYASNYVEYKELDLFSIEISEDKKDIKKYEKLKQKVQELEEKIKEYSDSISEFDVTEAELNTLKNTVQALEYNDEYNKLIQSADRICKEESRFWEIEYGGEKYKCKGKLDLVLQFEEYPPIIIDYKLMSGNFINTIKLRKYCRQLDWYANSYPKESRPSTAIMAVSSKNFTSEFFKIANVPNAKFGGYYKFDWMNYYEKKEFQPYLNSSQITNLLDTGLWTEVPEEHYVHGWYEIFIDFVKHFGETFKV